MRLGALISLVLLLLPVGTIIANADSLVINEILAGPARDWNGSGAFSSRDDEWIELMNTSASTLDLSSYLVTDADSLPRYQPSGTLAPGAVLLVTGKMSFDWEQLNGHPAFGLSLGNSGDTVILWKIDGADTTVVDAYTYKSHEAAADRASGRSPGGTGDWALFDMLNPYTGATAPAGTGCEPTPGALNTCGQTPARDLSWGRVKTLYRGSGAR